MNLKKSGLVTNSHAIPDYGTSGTPEKIQVVYAINQNVASLPSHRDCSGGCGGNITRHLGDNLYEAQCNCGDYVQIRAPLV